MSSPKQPLVSVIVTTYNNELTLDACLCSILQQSYPHIELIVADNSSSDATKNIARTYTEHVYNKNPERSTQRNFGVRKAAGEWVVIIDSDMELSRDVIQSCVDRVVQDPEIKGVVIPEESFGEGFWAECKRLERSFYVGVDWIEAARFFDKKTFETVGGYDESLVSGEDWDLSERIGAIGKLSRINEGIFHNEGHLQLYKTLKKKLYYAAKFNQYIARKTSRQNSTAHGAGPTIIVLRRFGLFFAHPTKLFRRPIHGLGMLFMKACEFGFGAVGYIRASRKEGA